MALVKVREQLPENLRFVNEFMSIESPGVWLPSMAGNKELWDYVNYLRDDISWSKGVYCRRLRIHGTDIVLAEHEGPGEAPKKEDDIDKPWQDIAKMKGLVQSGIPDSKLQVSLLAEIAVRLGKIMKFLETDP